MYFFSVARGKLSLNNFKDNFPRDEIALAKDDTEGIITIGKLQTRSDEDARERLISVAGVVVPPRVINYFRDALEQRILRRQGNNGSAIAGTDKSRRNKVSRLSNKQVRPSRGTHRAAVAAVI